MENELIQKMRSTYISGKLEKEDLFEDPFEMVKSWLKTAAEANTPEPTAMTLATASTKGRPSVRTVLLKEIDETGFIFYTNYRSRKAKHIDGNDQGALLFYWHQLERQIRIEGNLEKVTAEKSKEYFQSRPKGSQIGAWASKQSTVINDRSILNDRARELSDVYKNHDVLPLPSFWGGYRLVPDYFEFWQGRDNRLHDRFEFKKSTESWEVNRLAP